MLAKYCTNKNFTLAPGRSLEVKNESMQDMSYSETLTQ